ncbi:hypothetical protein V1292_005318 [Bradyrhizobium sp. AZCC 1719]
MAAFRPFYRCAPVRPDPVRGIACGGERPKNPMPAKPMIFMMAAFGLASSFAGMSIHRMLPVRRSGRAGESASAAEITPDEYLPRSAKRPTLSTAGYPLSRRARARPSPSAAVCLYPTMSGMGDAGCEISPRPHVCACRCHPWGKAGTALDFVQPLLKQVCFGLQLDGRFGSELVVQVPELGGRHRLEIAIPPFHHMPLQRLTWVGRHFTKKAATVAAFSSSIDARVRPAAGPDLVGGDGRRGSPRQRSRGSSWPRWRARGRHRPSRTLRAGLAAHPRTWRH